MENNQLVLSAVKGVRTRSPNFTATDRQMLAHLILPYMPVVENRSSTRGMSIRKKEVWTMITELYNEKNVRAPRTQTQLKLCYEAIKRKIRSDKLKTTQVSLNKNSKACSSVIQANAQLNGDVVLLNIDSKYLASSSQPNDAQMITIKLEDSDSDSVQIIDPSPNNLTLQASKKLTIESATQTTPEQSQLSRTQNQQRISCPPTPTTLIKFHLKCLYEKQIMEREQHKLQMQILREQLRKTEVAMKLPVPMDLSVKQCITYKNT